MIWYSEPLENVTEELQTDPETGLSGEQAAVLLKEHGLNKLNEKPPRSFFQRFLDQMKDVMVIILIIAAAVSLGLSIYHAASGAQADWIEPIVILLIVVINGLLGVIQESKAEAALEALKNMSAPSARVIRDGVLQTVKSTELVPGDIVEVEAGDLVPADCRLLEAATLKCDESALTGESVPVEKDAYNLRFRFRFSVYQDCQQKSGNQPCNMCCIIHTLVCKPGIYTHQHKYKHSRSRETG